MILITGKYDVVQKLYFLLLTCDGIEGGALASVSPNREEPNG